jgi:WD40 repeat protein
MAFTSDGSLVVIGVGKQVLLVEAATGRLVHHWNAHQAEIVALAISPGGGRIATAGRDGFIRVWGIE